MRSVYFSILLFAIFALSAAGLIFFAAHRAISFYPELAMKALVSMPSFYFLFWFSLATIWTVVAVISSKNEKHSIARIFLLLGAINLTTPLFDIFEAGIGTGGAFFINGTIEELFHISLLLAFVFLIQAFVNYAYFKIILQPNCCQIPKSVQKALLEKGHIFENK